MSLPGTIYVDLDDVLCETGRTFLGLLEAEYGKRVAFEAMTSYDLSIPFGMSRETLDHFMARAHEPEILGAAAPMAGAVEALEGWAAAGYRIEVVTGRPSTTRELSSRWLAGAGVPHDGLTFVSKYKRIYDGPGDPGAIELEDLAATEFCLAVEDSAETAVYLAGRLGIPVSLLDRPWNRALQPETDVAGEAIDGRIVRCRDWSEIASRFPRP